MSRTQYSIGTLNLDALPAAVEFWNSVVDERAAEWWWADLWRISLADFGDEGGNRPFTSSGILATRGNSKLVGMGLLRGNHPPKDAQNRSKICWIHGIAVAPSHRRQGIGSRILHEVEARASTARMVGTYVEGRVTPGSSEYQFLTARGYRAGNAEMGLELDLTKYEPQARVQGITARLGSAGICFRQYTESDLDALRTLVRRNVPAWWGSYEQELHNGSIHSVLLACHADAIVGAMAVKVWQACGRTVTGGGPVVDAGYRRRGIATVLMQTWAETARGLGALQSSISTGLHPDNPSVGLYLAMGYKRVAEQGYAEEWWKDLPGKLDRKETRH